MRHELAKVAAAYIVGIVVMVGIIVGVGRLLPPQPQIILPPGTTITIPPR